MMRRQWLVGLTAAVIALGATGVWAAATLNGAGASFPYPLYTKWIDAYAKKTGVKVNYQSVGSGAGLQQLKAKTVDFAGSDAPVSDEEMKDWPAKVVHVPTCFGAVALAYNLKGVSKLNLDGPTLAHIYLGDIKMWNDPKIVALNKGVNLPKQPIVVCHRSDGSGTTFIFTDYLSTISPIWKQKVGNKASVNWPCGLGGPKNDGVAGLVKQNPGAIGYVELSYAIKNKLAQVSLKNRSGAFILPTLASTTAAAAGAAEQMKDDVRVSLVNAAGKDAYPIVGATYLLVYQTLPRGETTTELIKFLDWAVTSGQSYCKELLYAPLPAEITRINQGIIKSIKVQ